ncbi:hypothetical protein GIB67_039750 [Kingdonia uniflora]|uniref:Fungal lipase-type domain-containing protein n=1 Tax=Kingdonia uniflora TaxID=39325 RepID=A0A7J7MPY1_9MAGN|nr:hypothetical protein GIB67_039750 [Kingdonia uniflora]
MMDILCFKAGFHGFSSPISYNGGGIDCRTNPAHVSALGRSNGVSLDNTASSRFSFTNPLRSFWFGGGHKGLLDDAVVVVEDGYQSEEESWVLKILHLRSLWAKEGKGDLGVIKQDEWNAVSDQTGDCFNCDDDQTEGCKVGYEEEEDDDPFDRDSFSKLLQRVSLAEAKVYAQMSYLGNLAYSIPKIKPKNLLKHQRLRFITSSVEKKAQLEKEQTSGQAQETKTNPQEEIDEVEEQRDKNRYRVSTSAAYHVAATAASYLQSHTKSILSFKSSKSGIRDTCTEKESEAYANAEVTSLEMASFVATTNSMTAVVAAKEEMKQAVAEDLNTARSSPCEWFICDDDQSGTRFFIIQGSESLASWQANLLFEPIQFEGLDVLVHRGIYEAAKGIYDQMLPEVRAHLKSRCDSATFRFTGHSLGGSLSLLVNLMLLIRGEVPLSSLLPVITFGAPTIMCGGDQLLRRLGLPKNHIQSITMHRDIVPRAFSCNYPDRVAELLKVVNGNFRNHPCLRNQKLLYAPMGEILILQPEEKFSPHHDLLPSGSGLYLLSPELLNSDDPKKQLRAAQSVFFNSPHPLEILSDRSAYGSDGTINRDHHMNSYLRSVFGVVRLEAKRLRKAEREHRRQMWWPLVTSKSIPRRVTSNNFMSHPQLSFSGVFRTGRESVKRFSRLVASEHMHLLVVFLFPAKFLLLGAYTVISFRW